MELIPEYLDEEFIYNSVGLIGVVMYVGSYSALQFGKLDGNSVLYCLLNGGAAGMVLISLFYDFNLASALIQTVWISLSIFGVCKYCYHKKNVCLLYTSPSPRDRTRSRMPSSA